MSSQQQRCAAAPGGLADVVPPPFRCTSSGGRLRAVRVEASGELDLFTTPVLERALREATVSAPLVVLDLHAITFIDTTGVHAIEDASVSALLRGTRLVVSRAPAHVARILAMTGTSATIELLDVDWPAVGAAPGALRLRTTRASAPGVTASDRLAC